jgi:hypothetical protein
MSKLLFTCTERQYIGGGDGRNIFSRQNLCLENIFRHKACTGSESQHLKTFIHTVHCTTNGSRPTDSTHPVAAGFAWNASITAAQQGYDRTCNCTLLKTSPKRPHDLSRGQDIYLQLAAVQLARAYTHR